MRILTAEAMRALDRRAIDEVGIPGMVLMENAAIGVVDAIAEQFPAAEEIVLLCGPGNNGGDGLAVARHLDARGYRTDVHLVLGSKPPSGDAALQKRILENFGLRITELDASSDLAPVVAACAAAHLVVDALFGTGLSRALGGHFGALVRALRDVKTPMLAVDLPSGLDGSRWTPPGDHLRAEVTVTFAAPKIAHVFPPAADACGQLVVADLGFPPHLVDGAPGRTHLLTEEGMAAFVAPREDDAHKGSFGHVLLVGGRAGTSGAVVLAARGAVRGGAGLVTAAVPEPLLSAVDSGSVESMTLGLPTDSDDRLSRDAAETALAAAADKAAVAVGPGLGQGDGARACVDLLVAEVDRPLVLDADALNLLAGRLDALRRRPAPTVLTPHPGEMARLLGQTTEQIQADRPAAALAAAEKSGAVVVLKGHRTLVATPEGDLYVNPTGNPGMATGGSGDVLTGLVAALLAHGKAADIAAQLAVFVHGLAGDLAIEELGPTALAAGDLITFLAPAWGRLGA
ncbi:MAG: NAD(P)H-hydrate dehydratase [Acidobacteriota bacterium]